MKWKELLDNIKKLKKQYPKELNNFYTEKDTQYINKFMVWFDKSKDIDKYKMWDIIKTWTIIDLNEEYTYNSRVIVYLQEKEKNWELSKIFFTKIYKNINKTKNWFVIDFINLFLI